MRRFMSAIGTLLSWIFLIALLTICVGPLVGSSLYLDRNGIVGPGVVTEKSEQIDPSDKSNRWLRRLDITVSYEPHDQSWANVVSIGVDVPTYDRLRVGSDVRVRYQSEQWLRQFPFVSARLEHQSTRSFFSVFGYNDWPPIALGLVAIALAVSALLTSSSAVRWTLVPLLGVTIAAIIVYSIRPAVLFDRGAGARLTATGIVRDIERITVQPGTPDRPSQDLLRPFDRVEIEFDPTGDGGTVVAVDDIDVGSRPGLAINASIDVTFPPENPRAAQIAGATRSHLPINWLMGPLELSMYAAVLALIAGSGFISRAFVRRRKANRAVGQQP